MIKYDALSLVDGVDNACGEICKKSCPISMHIPHIFILLNIIHGHIASLGKIGIQSFNFLLLV